MNSPSANARLANTPLPFVAASRTSTSSITRRTIRELSHRRGCQLREDVPGVEVEELVLPRADLRDVELVVAGFLVRADGVDVRDGIWPARHRTDRVLLAHRCDGLLEVLGRR